MKCECCDRKFRDHKWGKIRAVKFGWYLMRDGRSFCPDHRPEWAPAVGRN